MACYGAGSASATISLPNGTVDINGNSSLDCCSCPGGGGGGGGVVLTCSDPSACNYNSQAVCFFGNPCGTIFKVNATMAGQALDVFGNMQWCGSINLSVGGAELLANNDPPGTVDVNRTYITYASTLVSVSFNQVGCGTNAFTQTFCCGNNLDGSINPNSCPQGGSAYIEVLQGCAAQPEGCFVSVGQYDCGDTVRGDCRSEHNRAISYTITPCLEIDCNC